MTTVHNEVALTDQVIGLLADHVPAGVLDRVLLELLDAEQDRSDDDLRLLLQQGCLTGRYRTWRDGDAAYLVGIRTTQPARLVSRLRMHAEAFRCLLVACCVTNTLWVLMPTGLRAELASVLEQPGLEPHLALGRAVTDLRTMPLHRSRLDSLLDLGERLRWQGVADASRLEPSMRVEALLDLAAQRPELLEGPLDGLFAAANVVFAETLYQWFANDRDVAATATVMHLHHNTVRYRLRRAQELSSLDLSDWDQRLLAELQLRMWRGCRRPVIDDPQPALQPTGNVVNINKKVKLT